MSKKTIALLALVLALCLAFAACGQKTDAPADATEAPVDATEAPVADATEEPAPAAAFTAGTYTASYAGFGGNVNVTLTLGEDGVISAIDVDASTETAGIGLDAAPKVAEKIIEAQSVEVDGVSGATFSSKAVIEGVKDCLTQANALDMFTTAE